MSIEITFQPFLTYNSFIIHQKSRQKSPWGAGPPSRHSTDTSQAEASLNGCHFWATLGLPSHFWVDCHNQATNWASPRTPPSLALFANKSLCSVKLHTGPFQGEIAWVTVAKQKILLGVFPFFCFHLRLRHFYNWKLQFWFGYCAVWSLSLTDVQTGITSILR